MSVTTLWRFCLRRPVQWKSYSCFKCLHSTMRSRTGQTFSFIRRTDPILSHAKLLRALTQTFCSHPNAEKLNTSRTAASEVPNHESEDDLLNNLPPDEQTLLVQLMLEYNDLLNSPARVPKEMTDDKWLHLIRKCKNWHQRKKMYQYWSSIEKNKRAELRRKERKSLELAARRTELKYREAVPGFLNTPHLFVQKTTMNQHYYNNLAHAMMYGIPLVFDMGFEKDMSEIELKLLFQQIQYCVTFIKSVPDPFHFHLSGLVPNSNSDHLLRKYVQDIDTLPITVSKDSYLKHYSRDSLVYLTPNSPNILMSFDPNAVYIIGAIVDKAPKPKLTFPKAKKQKILSAKLPLDLHLKWGLGSKSLALDHMVKIMYDLKTTKDWDKALAHIPQRKLKRNLDRNRFRPT